MARPSPVVLLLDNWRLLRNCRLLCLRLGRLPLEESASLLAAPLLLIVVLDGVWLAVLLADVWLAAVLLTERISFSLLSRTPLRIHLADLRTPA